MDSKSFLKKADEAILQDIRANAIPDKILLDDVCWARIRRLFFSGNLEFEHEYRIEVRRVDAYCGQPDDLILDAIIANEVPSEVATDPKGWEVVCAVRVRNQDRIDRESWREVCRKRGLAGIPPKGHSNREKLLRTES